MTGFAFAERREFRQASLIGFADVDIANDLKQDKNQLGV
jgi:hypothetical protein